MITTEKKGCNKPCGPIRNFVCEADYIFGFEQGKDIGLERGVHPNPLQAHEDQRQFVASLERQPDLFDGDDRRMLQVQTPKFPQTFKHTANILARKSPPKPMLERSFAASAGHSIARKPKKFLKHLTELAIYHLMNPNT